MVLAGVYKSRFAAALGWVAVKTSTRGEQEIQMLAKGPGAFRTLRRWGSPFAITNHGENNEDSIVTAS
ncbi:unnamed protein product [Sphenostylis stenocarpa]|uniref:Uncharacterized protein n=1 Tax=Sphenostylis stenocarpa TaxID=92480 RepID=A0AA86V747_9FABA|nr:unnamed protein product [Sphenostylis stenocarpa]